MRRFNDKEVREHFSENSRRLSNGCLEWTGPRDTDGYGDWRNEVRRKAHRIAWELERGPIPPGMCVCHTCDNRACIEISHLWLGTLRDNMLDCIRKGRAAHQTQPLYNAGERNPFAKLTASEVLEIRRNYKGYYGQVAAMARRYRVNRASISNIILGRKWKWLVA